MLSTSTVSMLPQTLPDSPYRGIESFRYVDQNIFFAREDETRKLLRYVAVYRGVMFYGESGCGKSSLINAGFIPSAINEGFTPDRLRIQPKPGEEIVVERISTNNNGKAPFLPSSFVGPDDTRSRIVLSAAELKRRLQENRVTAPLQRPLLIFDQFEEFATLFEEVPRGDAVDEAQAAQRAVLDLISDLHREISIPVKLLFSFREDYLAKLSKLIARWPDLSDQSLRLTPPGVDALPSIIRGSFEKYPGSFGRELSENITRELAEALETRNQGGKLNLSEVQIACLELWKASDPEKLFHEKGVQGLLEDYLADSLNRLPPNLRDPAIALLSRMVTPSGTRNIVSEYDLVSQVHEDEGIAETDLQEALRTLVQQTRLVRRESRNNTYFYDIVSEFLVPWISRQKVERRAAAESRKFKEIERRRRRRALAFAAASLLVALGVAVAGFLVYREKKRTIAEQQKTIEFQQKNVFLELEKDKAVQQAREAEAKAMRAATEAEKLKMLAEDAEKRARLASEELKKQLDSSQKEVRLLTEKLNARIQGYDEANARAAKQADDAYKNLLAAEKDLGQVCNTLYSSDLSRQEGLKSSSTGCRKALSEIARVRADLRNIGR